MPRTARKKSNSAIYHVMLRGIDRQVIFQETDDFAKFLLVLSHYKQQCGYKIYAYCLMDNHVHLLIQQGHEELGLVFRRIGAKYVYWYNQKYQRSGHLFQDRYKSETVERSINLLSVLRYIHQNPVKAGMVNLPQQYVWSSYLEYTNKARICDTRAVLKLFADDPVKSVLAFIQFNEILNTDDHISDEQKSSRLDDRAALTLAKETTGVQSLNAIASLNKQRRNRLIRHMRDKGLSIRQISRLTGISIGIVRRC